MKKSSVKPHILSWLQRDPAAGVKPFVFTPNLEGKSQPYQSHLITRACLASTTSDFLLVDSSRKRGLPGWLARTEAIVPYRVLLVAAVICMTWPTGTSAAKVERDSIERAKPPKSTEFSTKPAYRN